MQRISGRIIRPFLYPVPGRIPDTENSRISGQIEQPYQFIKFPKMSSCHCYCFDLTKTKCYVINTGTVHLTSLLISYFTRLLNVELKIRPDIRHPALRFAGYPASRKSSKINIWCIPNFKSIIFCLCSDSNSVSCCILLSANEPSHHLVKL
jgi:hypothetical protein